MAPAGLRHRQRVCRRLRQEPTAHRR